MRNRLDDVLDVVDRIRNTGVLSYGLVGEVNLAVCVNGYVLEKGVVSDCVVNIRLALLGKVDNLCVAAAFEVEDAVIIPAVLIIADKLTLRIGGEGGLAGSGPKKIAVSFSSMLVFAEQCMEAMPMRGRR